MIATAFLVVSVAFGTLVRVETALRDPNFDAERPQGMLKSDPALLYYFVERIVESGGRAPPDFRADPRIEHPLATDIPALFPVGQEFVVAWCRPLFGADVPLHMVCLYVMSWCASLIVVGVFGLALELSRSLGWAVFAGAFCVLLPANYRTIGFLLVGEDFSVPWFLLHLWLAARAARVRTPLSVLLASVPLGIALSTWHALGFFVTLEAACVFAWFLVSGENPFAVAAAWIVPAVLAVFALCVPVLRHAMFLGSVPMQLVLGLAAAALWSRRWPGRRAAAAAVAFATAASLLGASMYASRALGGGIGEYSHVFGLVWQKILHLGVLPEDPRELPFEVRLMWQGPFDTLDLGWGVRLLGVGSVCLVFAPAAALRAWRARDADRRETVLLALVCVSIPVAWLIERTLILTAALVPVVAASLLARVARTPLRHAAAALVLAVQAALFCAFLAGHRIAWYAPASRQAEIAALVRRIPEIVPENEAIAADFVNSTAILAHTRHPILLQPKYEARRSRERAQDFLTGFFERTPAELRRMLLEKYRCRYVVFDRATLGCASVAGYAGGLPLGAAAPRPGTAAAFFLSQDPDVLSGVPGYRLIYRSPVSILQSNGSPSDFFRVYELAP